MQLKSNVLNQQKTSERIKQTLEDLTSILSNSLGPYGSTTIIEDKLSMDHVITKDGYTILNKIKFDNEVSTTILELVKKISRKLVREVGDGSTSAIVVANSLYNRLFNLMKEFDVPRKDIIDALETYQDTLDKLVNREAIQIDDSNFDKIKKIASISNNNDNKAGELIYEIYKKIGVNGFINLESSTSEEDSYMISEGIELQRGYVSNAYANQPDKVTCQLMKPLVFMSDETLDENDLPMLAELLGEVCFEKEKPLVIIAKGFDLEVKNFFQINKMQKRDLDLVVVDYALVSNHHTESFEDLSIYLGADIYNKFSEGTLKKFSKDRLGSCTKVTVDETNTKFIEGQGSRKKIDERIELIKESMEKLKKKEQHINTDEERYQFEKRIADLNCLIATLYIGGSSDLERNTRRFLMEDAVFACRSALRHGYVSGGNMIIPRVIEKYHLDIIRDLQDNEEILKTLTSGQERKDFLYSLNSVIKDTFISSYRSVLNNKYKNDEISNNIINNSLETNTIFNLKEEKYEDLEETNIINSVMTDIEIMKATFSIIGLLATSNQFVSVQYQ